MLLITRRTGESIVINGNIEVKIVDVRGGRVKLGFEYPEGNTVYRSELYQKIQEENRAAAAETDTSKLDKLLQQWVGGSSASPATPPTTEETPDDNDDEDPHA